MALSRDLLTVIMVFSANSLLSAGIFMVMDAVDVGFTEAAVGAGVSTILMLLALRACARYEQPGRPQWLPLAVVVATGATLVYGTMDLPSVGAACSRTMDVRPKNGAVNCSRSVR